uniref:NADH-ubiquinone oxidoreductase chain 6 n=1 Tax=Fukomys damarensis TaxID=885580 RepID=A0A0U2L066_FUKDA|nr:NADH dehydrogenase subunit 6 [Fukomys damarensis]
MVLDILLYLSILFVMGFIGFSVKPSPIYGGLALIISGGVGCGIVLGYGGSFLGLMVFLIFLGGMMVVFGYTTALAMDKYPDTWSSKLVIWGFLLVGLFMEILLVYSWADCDYMGEYMGDYMGDLILSKNSGEWVVYDSDKSVGYLSEDPAGVAAMYSYNYWLLFVAAWSILAGLLISMQITRGR